MTKLNIITLGDPRLRKKSKPIRRFDARLKQFADDMVETMRAANGVGLAAPQVGVNERLIVIEMPVEEFEDDPQAGKLFVVVNPEIVRARGEKVAGDEGCLSIPGYIGEVERYPTATIKGFDVQGKPFRLKTYDYLARIFQHEIDHLDGVLFIDHIQDPDKLRRLVQDPESGEWFEEPVAAVLA
ncbi:MAG: peptide deformylase [Chloroflexi bacterium]|nr:peptide deformylase [Chloroflexota bacterium]